MIVHYDFRVLHLMGQLLEKWHAKILHQLNHSTKKKERNNRTSDPPQFLVERSHIYGHTQAISQRKRLAYDQVTHIAHRSDG